MSLLQWSVCILLEQVVHLLSTQQTTVCDESSRVGGRRRGGGGARVERGHLIGQARGGEWEGQGQDTRQGKRTHWTGGVGKQYVLVEDWMYTCV